MLASLKYKALAFMGLTIGATFTSCSDKENETATPKYEVPATYNFQNVNYSGQQARIAMLSELDAYVKTGHTGAVLDAGKMKNMYANANAPFADAALNTSGKQLKNKTISTAQPEFEGFFDAVATASLSAGTPAINGKAGLISTTDGSRSYLVDANGVEYAQLIQKGLMGAVMYYQAVDHYLTAEQIGAGVDNVTVTPNEGTAMEHHWDEAFGYFGAPIDFPTNVTNLKFWASYSNQVNGALGSNKALMDAFLAGRAAISAKDMKGKDAAAATLRTEWERLVATSAMLELTEARENVADQARKSHYLSEAKGFIMGLKYKSDRKLTDAQYNEVMAKIGTNFYTTTADDIIAALNIISSAYALDAIKSKL